jgi:tetratricopeptide (TPR) repeat protein
MGTSDRKYTGHAGLGAELRRLRGGRTLQQVADLSRTPPLAGRIKPVAAPTLSLIENGVSMPTLETLHSLSVIYRASVQGFLDLIAQSRIAEGRPEPAGLDEARERYRRANAAGEWSECLATALWAEARSEGSEALKWRANRALALEFLGHGHEAVRLLQECVNDPDIDPRLLHRLHQMLSEALAGVGFLRSAALHARRAADVAPEDLTPEQRRPLLRNRAFLLLRDNFERSAPVEREVREALACLEKAAESVTPGDEVTHALIQVHVAACHDLLGNGLLAARDLERWTAWARAREEGRVLVEALHLLGRIKAREGVHATALKLLEEVAHLAGQADDPDWAFEAAFEAYRCALECAPERAGHFLRKCERYHPLLTVRSPNALRFERLERAAR